MQMTFDVKKLPDAPAVIGSWYEGFKFMEHGDEYSKEANAVLDEQKEPVFYILDMSELHTISVNGVMEVANRGAKVFTSSHHHAMNRETIIVSQKNIIKLAVKGVASPAFGNMEIKLFETLDEALNYVKSHP